jgi:drug/metabolite transporter (DMT)-like permease
MNNLTHWQDIARIAAGALFYSLLIIFTRSIQGMETLTITFFRAVFALLFFCVLLIWFRSPLKFSQYRPHLWKMLLMGCFMTATASLYIFSIRNTSAANAALLINWRPPSSRKRARATPGSVLPCSSPARRSSPA